MNRNPDAGADDALRRPTPEVVAALVTNHRQFLRFLEGRLGNRELAEEALRKQVSRSCGSCAEHGCLECTCGPGHGC